MSSMRFMKAMLLVRSSSVQRGSTTTEARKHENAWSPWRSLCSKEARRQSLDDAIAGRGTNADLKSGDWIEGSTRRLGYPRHPSRILPRASGGGGELCTVHGRRTGCGRKQTIAP